MAEAVEQKLVCYRKWRKSKTAMDRTAYQESEKYTQGGGTCPGKQVTGTGM